ncbi:MAG: ABC transporter ATP-binding protein [Bifidobacteriaceae bacterium]|nr:ABC transporter ATP-binding protein [Bifidobacteriaceae bacterium]MCI1914814.1 ABC transporter ATP-binding protein [Bifidobacteriaceae bacterium]
MAKTNTGTPAVQLTAVSKSYGSHEALTQVDAEIDNGEIFGLVGRNGAGKTTLMKLILGLSQPSSGTISINGSEGAAALNKERRSIGYLVGQSFFGSMNAVDNLKYFSKLKGVNGGRGEVDRVLKLVGLKGVKTPVKGYSMGMKQRFGIANALLGGPRLIILDEPINGLDPQGIAEMRDLFKYLNTQEGITIVISSHLLSELALTATSFGVIHDGRMVAELTHSELEHRTKAQRLEVVTSDNNRAAELLRDRFGVQPSLDDGTLVLSATESSGTLIPPEQVASIVLGAGLQLHELHTRRQSLEDFYFSITGGETNA